MGPVSTSRTDSKAPSIESATGEARPDGRPKAFPGCRRSAEGIWACINDEAEQWIFRTRHPKGAIGEPKKGWGRWDYLCSMHRSRCGQICGAPSGTGCAWKWAKAYSTPG